MIWLLNYFFGKNSKPFNGAKVSGITAITVLTIIFLVTILSGDIIRILFALLTVLFAVFIYKKIHSK